MGYFNRHIQSASLTTFFAVAILSAPSVGFSQAGGPRPDKELACSFEVASIRLSDNDSFAHLKIDGNDSTFRGFSFPANILVRIAYGVDDGQQVVGYPGWAGTEKYNIVAKVSEEQAANHCLNNPVALSRALRDLLQQRFALKAHQEQRQISLYGLWVIPGRLKLKPAARTAQQAAHYPDDFLVIDPPFTITGDYTTTQKLTFALAHILDRKVIDRTGLTDRYTFRVKYSGDGEGDESAEGSEDRPSIYKALNEQLGLRLVPEKSLAPVVVVDHIEHPSPN